MPSNIFQQILAKVVFKKLFSKLLLIKSRSVFETMAKIKVVLQEKSSKVVFRKFLLGNLLKLIFKSTTIVTLSNIFKKNELLDTSLFFCTESSQCLSFVAPRASKRLKASKRRSISKRLRASRRLKPTKRLKAWKRLKASQRLKAPKRTKAPKPRFMACHAC